MIDLNRTLILSCILAVSGVAQRVSDAERDLEAAVNKEVVQGDVNSAIGLYRKILSRYGSQREIAAKALFHLGQCHEKMGQAEARKDYERIVNEFADQKDLAAQARSRLASLVGAPVEGGVRVRRLFDSSDGCAYVSQDDQWAACQRNGDLYVRNLAAGKETLTARSVGYYALSADGRHAAYSVANRETLWETLWLSGVDGTSRRKIEGPADKPHIRSLAFSNDNRALFVLFYAVSTGGEIWLYPVQGGEGRKLHESRDLLEVMTPTFSPDGQFVVYRAATTGSNVTKLSVLPTKGGEPWEVPARQQETPVGFTSDGKLVLHRPGGDGSPSLWTLSMRQGRPEGQPQLFESGVSRESPGQYHASGKYYYRLNSFRVDLLSAQLDGVPPLITRSATDRNGGQGISPDYSSDGKLLAYASANQRAGRVIVRNIATGAEKEFLTSLRAIRLVRWYPDGSALLVWGYRGEQPEKIGVKLNLATSEVSNILPPTADSDGSFNPTFSTDGRYIYYKRFYSGPENRRVQRYEVSSGKEEEVYRAPSGAWLRLFAISPDGRQIGVACAYKDGENWMNWVGVAPLAGGETKVIYRAPSGVGTRGFSALAWTADSKSILFQTNNSWHNHDDLWRISLDGSPAQRLLTTGIILSIAVHPNGHEITLDSQDHEAGELWVMEGLK